MTENSHGPLAGLEQPSRSTILTHPRLHHIEHPLADVLLSTLRDRRVGPDGFGAAAGRLASFLIWEACRDVVSIDDTVPGFNGTPVSVRKLANRPAGIIILRAGEVFANPFRATFPDAPLYHLGIARDESTLAHRVYSDNVPDLTESGADRVLILDPMLATGGSIVTAIENVRRGFRGQVDVIALVSAPLGLRIVLDADGGTRVFTTAVDERLDERGYILPGLGDAGDRFFGTL